MKAKKIVATTGGPVHIICILDRSESMNGLIRDVIGGFNQFVKEQQAIEGDAILSLYIFDTTYEVIHDRVNLKDVPELTEKEYFARGMTALNDAIGRSLSSNHDARAIVFINTDGEENASREYTTEDVRSMVKTKTDLGWEFQFVGAGFDAWSVGRTYGFSQADSVSVSNDHVGVTATYSSMNLRAKSYRGA